MNVDANRPLACASARSRLSDPRAAGREAAAQALARVSHPRLALVFAAVELDQAEVLMGVRSVTKDLPVAGGASFAELTSEGFQTGGVVVALLGCGVEVALSAEVYEGRPREAAATAARAAARELGTSPDVALLFATGEDGECTDVVAGVKDVLGERTLIFGGGMAYREKDGMHVLAPSRQFFHDRVLTRGMVLVLLKLTGSAARLVTAVSHGLQPISQPVVCTRAEGSWVHEIDGENIFTFYEKFLGRKVEDVGQFIYTYPMLVTVPDQEHSLVRVPYTIDRAGGRIEFFPAGLATGQTATLAHFSRGDIVRAVRESAYDARVMLGDFQPRFVLAVSCNARQMFLGPRVASETRVLHDVFGADVPVAGFYSGGEIAPHCRRQSTSDPEQKGGSSQVVAQTFCVLAIGDAHPKASVLEPPPPPSAHASPSVEETLRQAHDEIRRLRQQIRDNEALLDLRERVLLRINRENIDVSRELRATNARLSELVADHVLGREVAGYVIESFVGAGGGGNVYRARHRESGRLVALKLLPKQMTAMQEKRFRREVKALARIQDRHVVPYIEGRLERPLPFLAMGLVEGATLENRLQARDTATLSPDETRRLALGIARGLAAAHAKKVLHRDLKPANVIVDRDGEAVLIDFGLARESSAAPGTSTVTVEGEVLGTVPYFSPEHFHGHPTQAASDVYQWGLLAHEMLTGTLPYPALDAWPSLLERFEKGVRIADPPPELAPLARLAERCLDPVPRRRPASGAELLRELEG